MYRRIWSIFPHFPSTGRSIHKLGDQYSQYLEVLKSTYFQYEKEISKSIEGQTSKSIEGQTNEPKKLLSKADVSRWLISCPSRDVPIILNIIKERIIIEDTWEFTQNKPPQRFVSRFPPTNYHKLNIGVIEQDGEILACALLRDENLGVVIYQYSNKGKIDIKKAQFEVFIEGMLMVLSHKESEISLLIVEMTDKEVVKQINSDMLVDSPLFDKLHLANCLKRCFKDVELVWVPRQMNKAAEKVSTHVKASFWSTKVLNAEIKAVNEILDNDKGTLIAYDVDE